jgi:hypothetical protein
MQHEKSSRLRGVEDKVAEDAVAVDVPIGNLESVIP